MMALTKNALCPFVQEPFTDCYCFNLTSRYINDAIHYCGNHFAACEIYQKNISAKDELAGIRVNTGFPDQVGE